MPPLHSPITHSQKLLNILNWIYKFEILETFFGSLSYPTFLKYRNILKFPYRSLAIHSNIPFKCVMGHCWFFQAIFLSTRIMEANAIFSFFSALGSVTHTHIYSSSPCQKTAHHSVKWRDEKIISNG